MLTCELPGHTKMASPVGLNWTALIWWLQGVTPWPLWGREHNTNTLFTWCCASKWLQPSIHWNEIPQFQLCMNKTNNNSKINRVIGKEWKQESNPPRPQYFQATFKGQPLDYLLPHTIHRSWVSFLWDASWYRKNSRIKISWMVEVIAKLEKEHPLKVTVYKLNVPPLPP